jgi:hypothetical protein
MGKIRRLSAVLLALLCVLALVPGSASATRIAKTPQMRQIERQIADAYHRIDVWNRRLGRWQVHVGRVAVHVERLTAKVVADEDRGGNADVLRRSTPRRWFLSYRLHRAHRSLRAILDDREAANAQQQIEALGVYIGQLESARTELANRQRKAPDSGGIDPREPLTYEAWARGFLARLGAPDCAENLTIVVAWETQESTSARFNPLATTKVMEGATDFNSVGVKNYVSLDQGLDASRDTLELGADSYGYDAILQSLRACGSAEMTARTINASAWCRGCGGGTYLTALLPIVKANYADHASRLISTG